MKILILVQGANSGMYPAMRKAQQETWDSMEVPGVKTLYYSGSIAEVDSTPVGPSSYEFYAGSDELNMAHWKMKLSLERYIGWHSFDFIFRTNASSYVDKRLLIEKAKTLPREKCYCGINGGGYASGCGVFMSPDVMQIVMNNLDDSPSDYEDALMGSILGKHGITVTPGAERQDFGSVNDPIRDVYHYRCVVDKSDRNKDIQIFHRIHDFKRRA